MNNKWIENNWVWLLAGAIVLVSLVCLVIPVRRTMRERDNSRQQLVGRMTDATQKAGKPHANEFWIIEAERIAGQVRSMRDEVAEGMRDQRRDFQTRRFYMDALAPPQERTVIRDPVRWLDRYRASYRSLVAQAQQVGIADLTRRTWAQELPRDEEIADAMTLYWLQKDLVDLFTNNEINMLEDILDRWGTSDVATPFDLVRNNAPGEPGATLRRLHAEGRIQGENLRDMLLIILTENIVYLGSVDIRNIMSEHRVAPQQGAEPVPLWDIIAQSTTIPAQRQIIDRLRRDGDWRHLHDYIIDLAAIRLRADLIYLFEAAGENYIADYLREPTPAVGAVIRTDINRNWSVDKVIDTLNTIIAIDNSETFNALVTNHGTPPVTVRRLNIAAITVRSGAVSPDYDRRGDPGMGGDAAGLEVVGGLFYVIPVELSVDVEFEKLPLLMRRLFFSDWSISIRSINVTRADQMRTDAADMAPAYQTPAAPAPATAIGRRRPTVVTPPGVPSAVEREPEDAWRRRATVDMVCEVRWFLPMKEQRESAGGDMVRR